MYSIVYHSSEGLEKAGENVVGRFGDTANHWSADKRLLTSTANWKKYHAKINISVH